MFHQFHHSPHQNEFYQAFDKLNKSFILSYEWGLTNKLQSPLHRLCERYTDGFVWCFIYAAPTRVQVSLDCILNGVTVVKLEKLQTEYFAYVAKKEVLKSLDSLLPLLLHVRERLSQLWHLWPRLMCSWLTHCCFEAAWCFGEAWSLCDLPPAYVSTWL